LGLTYKHSWSTKQHALGKLHTGLSPTAVEQVETRKKPLNDQHQDSFTTE